VSNQESLLPEEAVVAVLELLQPLARAVVLLLLPEKMARDKVEEVVHKLLEATGELLTDLEPRGQLARYLLAEKVVRAISTVEAVEAVATSVEVAVVPTLTARVMTREQVEVDPLLQILPTHQTLRTSRASKAAWIGDD
jgi:hypothetical protein